MSGGSVPGVSHSLLGTKGRPCSWKPLGPLHCAHIQSCPVFSRYTEFLVTPFTNKCMWYLGWFYPSATNLSLELIHLDQRNISGEEAHWGEGRVRSYL